MSDDKTIVKSLAQLDKEDIDAHHKPYFDWLRHVVTISLAALTALISLQGQYIPRAPLLIWTIQIAWAALALCILFGLFSLRWEFQMHISKSEERKRLIQRMGLEKAQAELRKGLYIQSPWSHRWAANLMLASLGVALAMLCIFVSVNLGR